ncbi:hypothetical protein KSP40_PGU021142 [Platanthera guangdongensis]|uniref:Uncharacterized protein n=1 Tax=Platanthera guangdongensis TaxID=2320717 RepID=A0ABR2MPT7_9ASPA
MDIFFGMSVLHDCLSGRRNCSGMSPEDWENIRRKTEERIRGKKRLKKENAMKMARSRRATSPNRRRASRRSLTPSSPSRRSSSTEDYKAGVFLFVLTRI